METHACTAYGHHGEVYIGTRALFSYILIFFYSFFFLGGQDSPFAFQDFMVFARYT
uniref:Uncharacterized protein n=1 Tax=Oryza brachyantha TaxID=4533 RepID=J3LNR1_ORYBR